jgi:hypothetical protein
MFSKAAPVHWRFVCRHVLAAAASLAVGYCASAAEPATPSTAAAAWISVQFRLLVNDGISNAGTTQGHRLLVSPGRPFDVYDDAGGATYVSSCVVNPLKNDLIQINCRLRRNGQVFATPSVATRDGQRCAVEIANLDAQGHLHGVRLEITPRFQK